MVEALFRRVYNFNIHWDNNWNWSNWNSNYSNNWWVSANNDSYSYNKVDCKLSNTNGKGKQNNKNTWYTSDEPPSKRQKTENN